MVHHSADATATPIISRLIKIQTGLTFLVLDYSDCPGKEAGKRVSVYYQFINCHRASVN